jgi:hypothetical protein
MTAVSYNRAARVVAGAIVQLVGTPPVGTA